MFSCKIWKFSYFDKSKYFAVKDSRRPYFYFGSLTLQMVILTKSSYCKLYLYRSACFTLFCINIKTIKECKNNISWRHGRENRTISFNCENLLIIWHSDSFWTEFPLLFSQNLNDVLIWINSQYKNLHFSLYRKTTYTHGIRTE